MISLCPYRLVLSIFFVCYNVLAESGFVKIKAEPSGAIIYIDGARERDATENWQIYELTPGKHVIRAEKKYFGSQQKMVTIKENEVTAPIIFRFEKSSNFKIDKPTEQIAGQGLGNLTIVTDIPGATVTLNGNSVNGEITPITVREIGEGEWTVEVALQSRKLSKKIIVKPGVTSIARFFFDAENQASYERKELATIRAQEENKRALEREADQLKNVQKEILDSMQGRFMMETRWGMFFLEIANEKVRIVECRVSNNRGDFREVSGVNVTGVAKTLDSLKNNNHLKDDYELVLRIEDNKIGYSKSSSGFDFRLFWNKQRPGPCMYNAEENDGLWWFGRYSGNVDNNGNPLGIYSLAQ